MNQKSGIAFAGLVLVCGVILFLGAGCAPRASFLTGQLSEEDKCVELMATAVLASSYATSYGQNGGAPEDAQQKMSKLENLQQDIDNLKQQYGWSDDDVANHCQKYSQQKGFMERVGQRGAELIKK